MDDYWSDGLVNRTDRTVTGRDPTGTATDGNERSGRTDGRTGARARVLTNLWFFDHLVAALKNEKVLVIWAAVACCGGQWWSAADLRTEQPGKGPPQWRARGRSVSVSAMEIARIRRSGLHKMDKVEYYDRRSTLLLYPITTGTSKQCCHHGGGGPTVTITRDNENRATIGFGPPPDETFIISGRSAVVGDLFAVESRSRIDRAARFLRAQHNRSRFQTDVPSRPTAETRYAPTVAGTSLRKVRRNGRSPGTDRRRLPPARPYFLGFSLFWFPIYRRIGRANARKRRGHVARPTINIWISQTRVRVSTVAVYKIFIVFGFLGFFFFLQRPVLLGVGYFFRSNLLSQEVFLSVQSRWFANRRTRFVASLSASCLAITAKLNISTARVCHLEGSKIKFGLYIVNKISIHTYLLTCL